MKHDGPSVRVIFNKDGTITEKNIRALQSVYREAVKPKKTSVKADEPASGRHRGDMNMGSSKKKKGNETYAKLAELGLTVFDPFDKSI